MSLGTRIELPVPLSWNRYYRVYGGRIVVSEVGRVYKEEAGWLAYSQLPAGFPTSGPITLDIFIYFKDHRKHDLDNALKVMLDAMKGIVYVDDDQIVEMRVRKGYDKVNPRCEFCIERG